MNEALFRAINGLAGQWPLLDAAMTWLAQDATYALVVIAVASWLVNRLLGRPLGVRAVLSVVIALVVCETITLWWAQPRPFADAAVLRSQIALEEGNIPFAKRLLEQEIKLVPDHAGLHENYAAALYLDGKLPDSRNELTVASTLGAPRWRVAYHLGLIEEASGRRDEASKLYAEALAGNPNWAPAQSRLKALRAGQTP